MFRSSKLGLSVAAVIGFAVVSPVFAGADAQSDIARAQKTLTEMQQLCDSIAARNAAGGGGHSVALDTTNTKPVMKRNTTTGGPSVNAKTGGKKGGAKKKKP
jgi:hypothetical protein